MLLQDQHIQAADIYLATWGFKAAPHIIWSFLCFGNYDHLLITTQVGVLWDKKAVNARTQAPAARATQP